MARIYELFFVIKNVGTCILHHSFTGSSLDEQMVSGFLSAISSFLNFIMPNSDPNKIIRAVDRGDFKIIIEPGKDIIGLLLAKTDTPSIRKILKETIKLFEEIYEVDPTADTVIYEPYKEIIVKKFAPEFISINDIPILSEDFIDRSTLKLLLAIDNTSDVKEISNRLNEPIELVIEKLAYLQELGIIQIGSQLSISIRDTDIFMLTEEGRNIFQNISYVYETIMNNFGKKGIDVLILMKEGKISVHGIHLKTKIDINKIKEIISFSLKEGWIKPIRIYPIITDFNLLESLNVDPDLNDLFSEIIKYCNGNHSLREISKKLNLPETVLASFLDKLGAGIEWVRK
ncbi:MAG: hypothetical protein ACTSRP_04895 [Candidatus Helarchaeota archaeon]